MKKIKLNIKAVLRFIVFALGVGVSLNGIVLTLTTNLNIGNLLTLCLGAFFIFTSIFYDRLTTKLPIWLKTVIVLLLCVVTVFSSFLLIYGVTDNVTYEEDAIIVLGAAIHGETPSRVLRERLDAVVKYYEKNNDVLIVVSGGQGPQESVTEAVAMEKYLIGKGIPEDNIVKEEKATSTYENFVFSKKILDNEFESGYTSAFISNEYHIYRAGGIAKKADFKNISHLHSTTRWYSVLPGTLRECLAVVKFWIFGK